MMKLDQLAAAARASSLEWSDERAHSVLGATLARRERRLRRDRIVRRSVVGMSGMATVLVLLLKGASATPATSSTPHPASDPTVSVSSPHMLAESLANDGGYLRD